MKSGNFPRVGEARPREKPNESITPKTPTEDCSD